MGNFCLKEIKESGLYLRIEGFYKPETLPVSINVLRKWASVQTSSNTEGGRFFNALIERFGVPSKPPEMIRGCSSSCGEEDALVDKEGNFIVFEGGIITAMWEFEEEKREGFIDRLKSFLGIHQ